MAIVELISTAYLRAEYNDIQRTVKLTAKDKDHPDTGPKTIVVLSMYEFLKINHNLTDIQLCIESARLKSTTENEGVGMTREEYATYLKPKEYTMADFKSPQVLTQIGTNPPVRLDYSEALRHAQALEKFLDEIYRTTGDRQLEAKFRTYGLTITSYMQKPDMVITRLGHIKAYMDLGLTFEQADDLCKDKSFDEVEVAIKKMGTPE